MKSTEFEGWEVDETAIYCPMCHHVPVPRQVLTVHNLLSSAEIGNAVTKYHLMGQSPIPVIGPSVLTFSHDSNPSQCFQHRKLQIFKSGMPFKK
jgi:hypothetical protein